MIPAQFDYVRAGSLDEALEALADPETKVLAGGHSLIPMMKLRLVRPGRLVDISHLDLSGIEERGGELHLGALTRHAEIAGSAVVPDALREAAAHVGDVQVRNMGTIGGSIAHGDPGSDTAAALLALGARIVVRSSAGDREIPLDGFFQGPFTTGLEPNEIVIELVVPSLGAGDSSAYSSVEDAASGYPLAGAAVAIRGGSVTIGVTGATAFPFIAAGPDGPFGDAEFLSDVSADAEYRQHLTTVVIERAIAAARSRA